ncbi:MAG: TIGR00159 family protein [Sphingomonadales bacterium]|nr:TIGR00159 family protein [Sphingomonadales bacterium]
MKELIDAMGYPSQWLFGLDLLLVLVFLYLVFMLVRGSLAPAILLGLGILYIMYLLVNWAGLVLLSTLLGQFLGLGVVLLIVLFQPEIRQFLLQLGGNTGVGPQRWFRKMIRGSEQRADEDYVMTELLPLFKEAMDIRLGMLIVVSRQELQPPILSRGTPIDARVGRALLLSVFQRESPIHDGAVWIMDGRVQSVACVLPVSESVELRAGLGLRHRAALGVSELADVMALVVSEEGGTLSVAREGKLRESVSPEQAALELAAYLRVE